MQSPLESNSLPMQPSNTLLRALVDGIPSPIVIFDNQGKIILWNRQFQKSPMGTSDKVEGRLLTEIFPYLKSAEPKILEAINSRMATNIEKISLPLSDKSIFEAYIYPIDVNNFSGMVLLLYDITKQVQMLEHIQQQDRLATLGMLLSEIAHEINNPVNSITSNISSLRNDFNDLIDTLQRYKEGMQMVECHPEALGQIANSLKAFEEQIGFSYIIDEIPKLLNGLEEGGRRTAEIIRGLRTFTRLDGTDMAFANITENIESTLVLLKSSYKGHIEIIREYEDIPEIRCFSGKLNQVFMNVLSNAIQAIEGQGQIHIKVSKEHDCARISIKDSGHGIKNEHINKIFTPFFTTKAANQGSGLGLTITNKIIKDHHGSITVVSEEGKGSEFIITIPY
jgi:two-component system NtrC family sensor kinase